MSCGVRFLFPLVIFYICITTIFKPYSYSFAAMFSSMSINSIHLYYANVCHWFIWINECISVKKGIRRKKNFMHCVVKLSIKVKIYGRKKSEWKNRHIVFEMMKKNFDINLFHENK